jgi:ubiquinone/menaquinone biosynthesis C-methylase UbiE
MPDYQDIYNDVVQTDARYGLAQNSPGFRAVVQAEQTLVHLAGRSLDVGCGIGFVFEYLSGHQFNFHTFGVDISDQAINKAKERLAALQHLDARLKTLDSQTLPFEDNYFSLVTSFDVLEHLDEPDIDATLGEINRVLRPGGTFYGAVSCRKSGIDDKFGDNLHRTVRSVDWWIEKTSPDHATWDGAREQFLIWKRASTDETPMFPGL